MPMIPRVNTEFGRPKKKKKSTAVTSRGRNGGGTNMVGPSKPKKSSTASAKKPKATKRTKATGKGTKNPRMRAFKSLTPAQRKTEVKYGRPGATTKVKKEEAGRSVRQSRLRKGVNPNTGVGKRSSGSTKKTRAVSRIAASKGITRAAANKIRKSKKKK